MEPKIQLFLMKLGDEKMNLALVAREICLSANPKITETIKWNNLTFQYNKKDLAFIYSFSKLNYVNLAMFMATSLKDPKNLFEGTGKNMRHIKISNVDDIPAKQIVKWFKESIALIEK